MMLEKAGDGMNAAPQHSSVVVTLASSATTSVPITLIPALAASAAAQGAHEDTAAGKVSYVSDPQVAAALALQQVHQQHQQMQQHMAADNAAAAGGGGGGGGAKRRRPDSSSGHEGGGGAPGEGLAMPSSQTQRRKESHNLTEQKRRQRINDKLAELRDILPSVRGDNPSDKQGQDKATILGDAIDFIRKLHGDIREAAARRSELERLNAMLKEENLRLKKAASA